MTADRIRLLWADADGELLDLCRLAFITWGFEFREAASGLECLTQLCGHGPDVLLFNSELGCGGAEGVLGVLHENCGPSDLPIIFVTGDPPPSALSRRFGVPAAHCLRKPCSLREMFHLISPSTRRPGVRTGVGRHRKER